MRQHRTLLLVVLALFAAFFAAYAVWWNRVAQRIGAETQRWVEARSAEGWTIRTGPLAVTGFPLGWRLDAGAASMTRPDGTRIETGRLVAHGAVWAPRSVRIDADAIVTSLPAGASRPAGTVTAARGQAIVDERIAVTLDAPSFRSGDAAALTAQRAQIDWRQQDGNGRDAHLRLEQMRLPANSPLGDTIQSLDVASVAEPSFPRGVDAGSIKAWRDAGGVLQLPKVALQWGALSLSAEGTAAVDAQGRVELAGTAHLTGWSETVDALVASGNVKPNAAGLAKAGLAMIARPKDGAPKEKGEVQVAVAIQDGQLYLAGIRLGPAPVLFLF